MNLDQWNAALEEAFLNEGPNRPVYLSATEAELQQMNDWLRLGMVDPVQDLKAALRPYSFLTFGNKHRQWLDSKTKDPPPWLAFLAATTVVVDRQNERGSNAFYSPLSDFLCHPSRITRQEYEETFYTWWPALKHWLEDDDRHAGVRGFATWGSIPQAGPRCVIGHPYTQVLLRQEERTQIDDFLAEFDHLDSEPPTARDRLAVAEQLVSALRRWARDRHTVTARLRRILEGADADESLSLGYVLLDRLFDEFSGTQRANASVQLVRLVPAYDDYQRIIRVVAIAPDWVNPAQPVFVPHAEDALRGPGDAVAIDFPINETLLREGTEFGEEPVARLVASRRYVMAAREWALWCSVEGALPGEELHLLLAADEARRFGLRPISGVRDLPPEWAICGPVTLDQLPPRLAQDAAATNRQLVPRLRGGLQLQGRVYLHGGEPSLELAEFDGVIHIDGKVYGTPGTSIPLRELDLDVGQHRIEVGGFDLQFHTMQSQHPVYLQPTLGRDRFGVVVPMDESNELVAGVRAFPDVLPPAHRNLIPYVDRFVKLGVPGEIGIVDRPLLAPWARAAGLPHVGVEVHAKSTHPDGDRLVKFPWWIAWPTTAGAWVIAELPQRASERDDEALFIPQAWSSMCDQIGASPAVWGTSRTPDTTAVVLERWNVYRHSSVDE